MKLLSAFIVLFGIGSIHAQTDTTQYRVLPADTRFEAGKWKALWWGKHWRDEWRTPLPFPVFNFDTTAGGLKPVKLGGGHQTKTLRLLGANGKEYVLRTVYKNLEVLIPDEFKGSFVQDVINDQISTAHPYGPLVVAELSKAIGILHTNPVIVFVPDHPALGEFANHFANRLCLFEERPSGEGWDNTSFSGYASNIINSEKLFEKLQDDHDHSVDQAEYLKIRLFDMWINDWDRHEDQWVWAAQKKDGKTIYRPFARDRDQSFSRTDGINLFLLSRPWAIRSLQNLDATIHDVIGTNLSARFTDRQFTNALTPADWQRIIAELQQQLSDSIITQSINTLPIPIRNLSGGYLVQRLTQRRDNMMDFGMKYYNVINKEITITGSDKNEQFIIDRITRDSTVVTVYTGGRKTDIIYQRRLSAAETKEISLYGMNGNDRFIFRGLTANRIETRVLGGNGTDTYLDETIRTTGGRRSTAYDDQPGAFGNIHSFRYKQTADTAFTNYNRMRFAYDYYLPLVWFGANPDDGFIMSGSVMLRKKKWGKRPFASQHNFNASYAAATGAYRFGYNGLFKQVISNFDVSLEAGFAPRNAVNFYGFGNETVLPPDNLAIYSSRGKDLQLRTALIKAGSHTSWQTGLQFSSVRINADTGKYAGHPSSGIDPSAFTTQYFGGGFFNVSFSTVDNSVLPRRGIRLDAELSWQTNFSNTSQNFLTTRASILFYYSPLTWLTLAHRTGVASNIGDYQYYQANTLGGTENLRGYRRTRFTGQTAFFQNTELRIRLGILKGYVFRGTLGIYGFFDDGRVWIPGESSGTIHTGYGGGIFFAPFHALAIKLAYTTSRESNLLVFRTGFFF